MRHAGLTCGFVFRLDRAGMPSRRPDTIDGRAQASSHWARLLLFSVIVFCLFMLSLNSALALTAPFTLGNLS